ncbi:PEP-CTERM sorting domain-containing protein [Erythrobacter litoralis]|uniref:PEP-CTERM sorting domain-containing protein n=1 Tax=Erythrobacter litoralis TaxID=39960 RepID=UPI00243573FF|nr:PEP-CTERM sorting domain-containing protein [Erythrobacter litoralis]
MAAPAGAAQAAEYIFDFETSRSLIGGPVSGNGVFTVSDTPDTVNGREAFLITDISGVLNGSAITGLTPGVFGADNYFYMGEFFVRGQGIGFTNAAGTTANLFLQQGSQYRVNTTNPFTSSFVNANVSLATGAVPEPGIWALMLLSFAGIGAAMRRKNRTTKLAYSFS